jgi:hypothetical protein
MHGRRLEINSLTAEYRTWCGQTGCAPIGLSELLDEIENVQLGVRRLGARSGSQHGVSRVPRDPGHQGVANAPIWAQIETMHERE